MKFKTQTTASNKEKECDHTLSKISTGDEEEEEEEEEDDDLLFLSVR